MKLTLGDRLMVAMKRRGVTAAELAKATYYSRTTVHRWIYDLNAPTMSAMIAVADYLKVSERWLARGEEENENGEG